MIAAASSERSGGDGAVLPQLLRRACALRSTSACVERCSVPESSAWRQTAATAARGRPRPCALPHVGRHPGPHRPRAARGEILHSHGGRPKVHDLPSTVLALGADPAHGRAPGPGISVAAARALSFLAAAPVRADAGVAAASGSDASVRRPGGGGDPERAAERRGGLRAAVVPLPGRGARRGTDGRRPGAADGRRAAPRRGAARGSGPRRSRAWADPVV